MHAKLYACIYICVCGLHLSMFINFLFINGRSLSSQELYDLLCWKVGYMAVKLDMSEAYDRVEWVFSENVMRKMGFDPKWIGLIMRCISTVHYAIIVDGTPVGNIRPSRGIRQGGPLSLYLFLICVEVLSVGLQKAARGVLTEVPMSWGGYFFADDSLIFCKANRVDWRV